MNEDGRLTERRQRRHGARLARAVDCDLQASEYGARWGSFFFFQAEDGIRDLTVTGVQTCALPIWTGRTGPATWEAGDYATGQENHPAAGVSWYEAAAFAKFAGKSVPTVFHWNHAASEYLSASIVPIFFSSRRRHTRFDCDWSSDVCSSD